VATPPDMVPIVDSEEAREKTVVAHLPYHRGGMDGVNFDAVGEMRFALQAVACG